VAKVTEVAAYDVASDDDDDMAKMMVSHQLRGNKFKNKIIERS
jgi:hypothetical protein